MADVEEHTCIHLTNINYHRTRYHALPDLVIFVKYGLGYLGQSGDIGTIPCHFCFACGEAFSGIQHSEG